MHYSNGNYYAFSKPVRPLCAGRAKAYIIGNNLSALAAAFFLIRDGQFSGADITIIDNGESLTHQRQYYAAAGERPMEKHFECMWDLFRSVPSLQNDDFSVLDEFYWLNESEPSSCSIRVMEKQGKKVKGTDKFGLSDSSVLALTQLMMSLEENLASKRMKDILAPEFFKSNFWLLWRTTFCFSNRHSAMEMRRYLARIIHLTSEFSDLSFIKSSKYGFYDSFVVPLTAYLKKHNVHFISDTVIDSIQFTTDNGMKKVRKITYTENTGSCTIQPDADDLVFINLGDSFGQAAFGDDDHAPVLSSGLSPSWQLWQDIATQDSCFGTPSSFCREGSTSRWESLTITCLDDKIPSLIEEITGKDPFSGQIITGGPVTIKDSAWLLSWRIDRHPYEPGQNPDHLRIWLYGLLCHKPGNYINKPMTECTGKEILKEWLFHLGIPVSKIDEISSHASSIPCRMPYITSAFMVRGVNDRPCVVPKHSRGFAFIGDFVETPREISLTWEYQIRTAMEAVYTLLDLNRDIPEVYASCYDARSFLNCISGLMDGKKITDLVLPFDKKVVLKKILKNIKDTTLEALLKEYGLL